MNIIYDIDRLFSIYNLSFPIIQYLFFYLLYFLIILLFMASLGTNSTSSFIHPSFHYSIIYHYSFFLPVFIH